MGLVTRVRKVINDEFLTERSVKNGKSHLVTVSEEVSDNAKRKLANVCTYYKVSVCLFRIRSKLGHAAGQELRASLSVEDTGFAKSVIERISMSGDSLNESK